MNLTIKAEHIRNDRKSFFEQAMTNWARQRESRKMQNLGVACIDPNLVDEAYDWVREAVLTDGSIVEFTFEYSSRGLFAATAFATNNQFVKGKWFDDKWRIKEASASVDQKS